MKRLALILALSVLYGCPPGGGNSPTSPTISTAPTISNLWITPSSVSVGDGGGAVTVELYVDFFDEDGDIVSYTVSALKKYTDGRPDESLGPTTISFAGILKGETIGTAHWIEPTDSLSKRTTTFSIYVSDKAEHKSNKLTGTFEVL